MSHIRPLSAGVALVALLGAATSAAAGDRLPQGVLAELPADAPPGDCYAHVRVRGPEAPPQVGGAVWVQTPGPPGAPGPIWCLVPTAAPVAPPVMQEGWIRVVCDRDITPDRVRTLQRHLHDRGFYQGPQNGEYDRPTADAVGRFQRDAHLDHGGHLSLDTWEALSGDRFGPPPQYSGQPPLPPPPVDQYDRRFDGQYQTGYQGYQDQYDHSHTQPNLPPPPRFDSRYAERHVQPVLPQLRASATPQANVVVRRDDVGGVQRYYSHQSYSRSSSNVSPPVTAYGGYGAAYGYGAGNYAQAGAYGYDGGYASGYGYGAPVAGPAVYAQPEPAQPYPNAGWRPPYAAYGAGLAVQNGYLVWGGKTRF